jgi:hypothetical protein
MSDTTIDQTRFRVQSTIPVPNGTKVTGSFDYVDMRGDARSAIGHIYLPDGLAGPAPLLYTAGYEIPPTDDPQRPSYNDVAWQLARGWVVANPAHPTDEWPGTNPMARTVNLDVAFLHLVRAQPFVDDARVMITGSSAGGWMTYMLAAETFPLAGAAPDCAPVDYRYNVAYAARNADAAKRPLPDGRKPGVPGVAIGMSGLLMEAFGSDFGAEVWDALSPLSHAPELTSPIHSFFSTADVLVPVNQVVATDAKLSGFPEGFVISARDVGVPERTLMEAFPDADLVRIEVPPGTPKHDIEWLLDGVDKTKFDFVWLPLPNAGRVTVCLIDEGPVDPRNDHYGHRVVLDRTEFWDHVTTAPLEAGQLTSGKLATLLARHRGEEWIRSGFRHLDAPDAERADVERGLRTYRAQGAEHDATFRRLWNEIPPDEMPEGLDARTAPPVG